MKQSIQLKLENLCERYDEIAALLSEPEIQSNQNKFRTLSQEYAQIAPLVDCYKRYELALKMLESAQEMANDSDPELREMAKEEVNEAEDLIETLDLELQVLLLPKDPNDNRNIFLEVRAGTGGDEASIFAGDLLRMYMRYCERKGWKEKSPDRDQESIKSGFQAKTVWSCSPSRSIPRRIWSPGFRNWGVGFMPMPTPGGVPVVIKSPGCKVMKRLR